MELGFSLVMESHGNDISKKYRHPGNVIGFKTVSDTFPYDLAQRILKEFSSMNGRKVKNVRIILISYSLLLHPSCLAHWACPTENGKLI